MNACALSNHQGKHELLQTILKAQKPVRKFTSLKVSASGPTTLKQELTLTLSASP